MQSAEPFVQSIQDWNELFMRRSMHKFIHYSKTTGLSMPQIGALFRIQHHGTGISDLSHDLGVTSAAISQMLETLVQQGYVLRSEDPNDRRAKQIVITEKGQQVLQESVNARQAWLDALAGRLSSAEKEQVTAAFHVLIQAASQIEE